MKYFSAILTLIILDVIAVVTLLYFGSITRKIEHQNNILKTEITNFRYQLKINEVEYSLHNTYSYLKQLEDIYFDDTEIKNLSLSFVSFSDFEKNNIVDIYKISTN